MRKSVARKQIADAILVLRGHPVLLDSELATLYGVTTKRLNEQELRTGNWPADSHGSKPGSTKSLPATMKRLPPSYPPFVSSLPGSSPCQV